MPDPKPKKRKKLSKDPDDIAKTLQRDYPKYTATYAGEGPEGKSEFRMRSESGRTFTIRRGEAFPAVEKKRAEMLRKRYKSNNK